MVHINSIVLCFILSTQYNNQDSTSSQVEKNAR